MLDAQAWLTVGPLLEEIVHAVVEPYGVQAKVERVKGVPPVVNTSDGIEAFRLASLAGGMHPVPTAQSLGGEDFSWYLAHATGAMARLGTRTPGGPTFDLHQGDLVVDEDAVALGARLLASVAVLRRRGSGTTSRWRPRERVADDGHGPRRHRLARPCTPRPSAWRGSRTRPTAGSPSVWPAWSTTAGSSPAATSRTPPTESTLCAECGMVSQLHATGGGVLVAVWCVDKHGDTLMPCGRCRQLLWECGAPDTLLQTPDRHPADARGAAAGLRPRRAGRRRPRRLSLPDVVCQIAALDGPLERRVAARRQTKWRCVPRPCHDVPMSEPFDAVDVITTKRDRHELTDDQIRWVIDAYTRGAVADEQMSALAMAVLLNGMTRREISTWTAAMIASGERMDFSVALAPDRRQALDRRCRRQDHAAAGPARRRLRRRRAAAVGPRPGPHRRHPRQARVDPRLAGVA